MHTTAYWVTLERPMLESLPFSVSERQAGMLGVLHALECVATLLLMCDRRDLARAIGERPPEAAPEDGRSVAVRMEEAVSTNARELFEPNLYLYDAYPGGIGFSEPLFRAHDLLVRKTRSEEHTSELQSRLHPVCRLPLEKKKRGLRNFPRRGPLPGGVGELPPHPGRGALLPLRQPQLGRLAFRACAGDRGGDRRNPHLSV